MVSTTIKVILSLMAYVSMETRWLQYVHHTSHPLQLVLVDTYLDCFDLFLILYKKACITFYT